MSETEFYALLFGYVIFATAILILDRRQQKIVNELNKVIDRLFQPRNKHGRFVSRGK